ncbi:glycosyltransferase involved in cell wall biosynthesis [Luteibacter rhizovicinus]|uniref:Glycosyltransferase involved in cell wall biosynthesis n=1 Tax=Luteibacter rhizovicinus TaxID=242606 RepID=A0A4R3YQQ0_9GAMM|nr:glycosyltransferase family 1 protein [Luteibacter rhizovicinus]TCV94741.1 glycosyltransferase involved in cell wall biosynthesis [Luteibacter rhizovicinus]
MRIGIVTETYPPEVNGVALTVRALVQGMVRRGHTVDLVRPLRPDRSGIPDAGIDALDVAGVSLPRYAGLRFGLPARYRLERRWRESRPDAIYVATEGPLGWSAVSAARRLGIPVATGFHTRFDTYADHYGIGLLTPLVRSYLARFHRRSMSTLVPTRALAEELATMGVNNVRVLRRAVDTRQFHPSRRDPALRATWGVSDDTPVVLYVGRIAPEKNLPLSVAAFRALQRRLPDARYVFVGDGPARAAIAAANPDFIFMGVLHGDALAAAYASADLFVFPSLSETFGNVLLEAMASGVAVVAYSEGAAREHIQNGQNGIRVVPGNEAGFIERSASLGADIAARHAMGRAACLSVSSLSPDVVIADFESLLRTLAEETRHERPAAIVA